MLADALQDIDEIRVGVDPVQAAGHDQALHDSDVFGAECARRREIRLNLAVRSS
jgi:hypothetical protein